MNFSRSRGVFACALAGLLATAPALAQETQGKAWIQVDSVNIYDAGEGLVVVPAGNVVTAFGN